MLAFVLHTRSANPEGAVNTTMGNNEWKRWGWGCWEVCVWGGGGGERGIGEA